MGLFQNEIQIVGKPISDKPDKIKLKSLNGYGAIREKLDETNTWTVKHPPVQSVKPKNHYWFELD